MTDDPAAEMERLVREDADHVFVEFPDINGISRSKRVTAEYFLDAWEAGFSMNMTLLATPATDEWVRALDDPDRDPGYGAAIDYADGTVHPIPESAVRLPWDDRAVRVRCDVEFRGEPPGAYTRHVLSRVLDRIDDLEVAVGTEPEFAVLSGSDGRNGDAGRARDGDAGRFRPVTDRAYECVTRATESVSGFADAIADWSGTYGAGLRAFHHEDGRGQFEAMLEHGPPLSAADRTFDFRRLVRRAAEDCGLTATFATRPLPDGPTNGLHVHVSAHRDGANLLGEGELSAEGRAFVAGILEHAPALIAVSSPTLNALKRYRPAGFAPDTRSWGYNNRTAAVRVPEAGTTRIENRLPAAEANPYLAIAGTLAAGMDGLERDLDPGDPVSGDATGKRPALLRSPEAVLRALEEDRVVVEALGEEFVDAYTTVKRDEIDRFYDHVTDWERGYVGAI